MKQISSVAIALVLGAAAVSCGDDSASNDDLGDDAGTDDDTSDDDTSDDDTSDDDTSDDDDVTGDDDTGDDDITDGFMLSAAEFEDGDALPPENTCEGKPFGEGVSPELNWSGAPDGTMFYALVFKDTTLVDAGNTRQGYHWAAYNIPVSVEGIPYDMSAGEMPEELMGGSQFRAGPPVDEPWFFGPCPSWNTFCSGAERANDSYAFTLYAFDSEVAVPDPVEGENYAYTLEQVFMAEAAASTELTATSDAAPTEFPFCPVEPGDAGAGDAGTGFEIMATAFDDGEPLPDENTCEGKPFGEGVSPELMWSGAPEGTQSYVLIFKDTTLVDDGNTRQGYHWAAYNIPVSVEGIPHDMSAGEMPDELMGGSQFRAGPPVDEPWFFGPCPSWNTFCSGAERANDSYSFTLYALPEAAYTAPDAVEGENYAYTLETYFAPLAVGMTELTATSNAAPTEFPFCPVETDAGPNDAGVGDAGVDPDAGLDAGL